MEILGVAIENILVGVLAALSVGLILRLKDYAYDKYIERKYPIEGEYLTTFEDIIDGEKATVSAPARIKQKGKKIVGTTIMPGEDRRWNLEGDLHDRGYVNGIYYSPDPHDQGIGNFFLYINYDCRMEGIWSGYDEANDQISSGRYTFVPTFDSYNIREIEEKDIPAIINISENRLGKDYISVEMLQKSLDDQDSFFVYVAEIEMKFERERSLAIKLAGKVLDQAPKLEPKKPLQNTVSGQVIGFSIGAIFDQKELDSYLNISRKDWPLALQSAEKIGVLRTIAVDEQFEARGVGTELAEKRIQRIKKEGVTAFCAVGWEEDGNINISGLMEYFGFKKEVKIENYWKEDSIENGYYYASCGEPPCSCSAIIFTKY